MVGSLLNLAVVVAILVDPLKILRKGPWMSIVNLSIADLITCITSVFLFGNRILELTQTRLDLVIIDFFYMFGRAGSFFALTLLSYQVFIVTKYPFESQHRCRRSKIIVYITVLWLVAFPLGMLNTLWYFKKYDNKDLMKVYIANIAVLEIAVAIQIFLNISVIKEILRSGQNVTVANARHKQMANMIVYLTTILVLTAFPPFVLTQIQLLVRLKVIGTSKWAQITHAVGLYSLPIAMLNYVINPIVYSLRLSTYRKTLLFFLCFRMRTGLNHSSSRQTTSVSLQSWKATENSRKTTTNHIGQDNLGLDKQEETDYTGTK